MAWVAGSFIGPFLLSPCIFITTKSPSIGLLSRFEALFASNILGGSRDSSLYFGMS